MSPHPGWLVVQWETESSDQLDDHTEPLIWVVLLRPSSLVKLKSVFPSAATEGGPETKVPHPEPMGWPDVERCLGTAAAATIVYSVYMWSELHRQVLTLTCFDVTGPV